jgi:hypothetical protein
MDWIHLIQDRDQRQAFVDMEIFPTKDVFVSHGFFPIKLVFK